MNFKELIEEQRKLKSNFANVEAFIGHCECKIENLIKENPFNEFWAVEICNFSKWFILEEPKSSDLKAFVEHIRNSKSLSKGIHVEFKSAKPSVGSIVFPNTIKFSLHKNNLG